MERWLVERVVLLLSLIAAVRAGSRYESASLIADFVADIETAPPGTKVVVFDVGANDGKWTSGVIAPILRRAARKGLVPHAYILEPQPVFREPLTRLAESLAPHVTFIAAAAWKQNTTLSLFSSERGSKSATLIPSKKSSGQSKDQTTTIDLAELIEGATRATDGERVITLLKLDVEGTLRPAAQTADPLPLRHASALLESSSRQAPSIRCCHGCCSMVCSAGPATCC
jgi:FkbM family methyltransferase